MLAIQCFENSRWNWLDLLVFADLLAIQCEIRDGWISSFVFVYLCGSLDIFDEVLALPKLTPPLPPSYQDRNVFLF